MLSFRPIKRGTNNDKSLYLRSHSVSTPITALRKRIVLKCLPCSDEKGFTKILNSGCNYFSNSAVARFLFQTIFCSKFMNEIMLKINIFLFNRNLRMRADKTDVEILQLFVRARTFVFVSSTLRRFCG